jgi:hypothetical protein
MPSLKYLKIEITPEHTVLHSGRVASEIIIRIDTLEEERIEIREMLPDNDFQSRFDWIMERARRSIVDRLRSAR